MINQLKRVGEKSFVVRIINKLYVAFVAFASMEQARITCSPHHIEYKCAVVIGYQERLITVEL